MTKKLSVLLVSQSDGGGGANRAAHRLLSALQNSQIEAHLLVRVKTTGDPNVIGPDGPMTKLAWQARGRLGDALSRALLGRTEGLASLNLIPSRFSREIARQSPDVVNLHWMGRDTMSVFDIARIDAPVLWTFHDYWPASGFGHVPSVEPGIPTSAHQLDNRKLLAKRAMERIKAHLWKRPITAVCPSNWMQECLKRSPVTGRWETVVIPNPVPLDIFQPWEKRHCRRMFGLPVDRRLILFGANASLDDRNKGFDLFVDALKRSNLSRAETHVAIFGNPYAQQSMGIAGFRVSALGPVRDDRALSALYSAADVCVVPSRCENLPQVAAESISCGVPVVGFRHTGMKDVVEEGVTGFLANPFDTAELSNSIEALLTDETLRSSFSANAVRYAQQRWNPSLIASKYESVMQAVFSRSAYAG